MALSRLLDWRISIALLLATCLELVAAAAAAAPAISITAPPPGQPLYNLEPLITVSYSSPVPPGLNLDSLQVLVNGSDWTARFSKTADSASHQVTPEERFTAGTLTVAASIRDTTGVLASASETYAVHPTLLGLSPAAGPPGITLTVSARGLDAVAENNALLFPSAYGGTLRAPFTMVDPLAGSGTAVVPPDTRSGSTYLESNGRRSADGADFRRRGDYATCGQPEDMRPLADGSLLTLYYRYYRVVGSTDYALGDPECPVFSRGGSGRTTVVRLHPDRSVSLEADWAYGDSFPRQPVLGIAVEKSGLRYAYLRFPYGSPGHYNLYLGSVAGGSVSGFFVGPSLVGGFSVGGGGTRLYMDFDETGNLYFVATDANQNEPYEYVLYRLPAPALAAGGVLPLETFRVLAGITAIYGHWIYIVDTKIDCTGAVYVAWQSYDSVAHLVTTSVRRLDLSSTAVGVDVVLSQTDTQTVPLAERWHSLALTCHPDVVVVSTTTGPTRSVAELSHLPILSGGAVSATLVDDYFPAVYNGPYWAPAVAIETDGAARVGMSWGPFAVPAIVPVCGSGPQATARAWPCPPMRVLPATPRWRPQRDTTSVEVHFSSPVALAAAALLVKDPAGTLITANTGALQATGTATYKLAWTGPWTRLNPGTGELEPLPAGHYRLVVTGTRADTGATLASNEKIVSLVEVSEVRFEALPDAPPLDDNPAVPALTEQGQDPNLGRPGGGRRIFAEATAPGAPVHNRVKVVAVIAPPISPDASLPPEATTVRVHFKSFDVDDPAPHLPDKDGDVMADAVDDNRGTPANGVLASAFADVVAGSTTASTELEVSLQPGDNYRVAASTSATWLAGVHAKQSVAPAAPVQDGALSVSGPNATGMLTVWRTLHLEIDSMAAPPGEDTPPGAPEYAERNFIKGRVLRISAEGPTLDASGSSLVVEPRYVYVEPEATPPSLGLGDGSRELPEHGGRFERGRLRLGAGTAAVNVDPLDGNGTDATTSWEYVRAITTPPESPRIAIPFALTSGTLRRVTGRVLAWDSATRVFTLDKAISALYTGGTLAVAGLEWTVSSVNGAVVTVVEDQALPFVLTDDDPNATANPAFPVSSVYLEDNDNPAENVFAQAYVRPKRDLVGSVTPPFIRNIWAGFPPRPGDADLRQAQLAAGREWQSALAFWVSYVQGASQADAKHDDDPDDEGGYLGWSEGLDDRYGLFVFVDAINDHQFCPRSDQMDHTFAHEVGHHFGLEDNSGGIMNWDRETDNGCVFAPNWFTGHHLSSIRAKGVQP